MAKNLPSSAGDKGLIPARGAEIPHATGQLSPCSATAGPEHSRAYKPSHSRAHA